MNLGPIKDKSHKGTRRLKSGYVLGAAALCCAGVIGLTASLAYRNRGEEPTPAAELPASNNGAVICTLPPEAQQTTPTDAPVSGKAQVEAAAMLMPVDSEQILKSYSVEALVYSATLKQWQTHAGVDIAAKDGAAVLSVLDGTVKSVENDALMGTRVTVTHDGGFTTVYASMGSVADGLKAGSKVLRGQKLGTVGTSAASEADDGAHLHFEVYSGTNRVNPQTYLSDLSK